MLWALFSIGLVSMLVGLSYRHLLAMRRLARWAAPYLAQSSGKSRSREPSDSASAEELRVRVADLNEATIELGFRLGEPGFLPRACAKAALSVGALTALMQGAQLLGGSDPRAWSSPLLSLAGGGVGALGCLFLGRAAETEARRLRDEWRTLIRRSTQDVPT